MDNTNFYTDRRPDAKREDDEGKPLGYHTLRQANRDIMDVTPDYLKRQVHTKIRTTAVHRHRGKVEFEDISEYKNFISGCHE